MDNERVAAPAAAVDGRSDLPPELWEMIGRLLDSHIDILRFRSACSTWRSLVPRLPPLQSPISVPHPGAPILSSFISISPATIFRLEPVAETSQLDGSFPYRQGWLIKISESSPDRRMGLELERELDSDLESELKPGPDSNSRKMRLLNPLSSLPILYKPGTFPINLDLLKFRVTELCKEYSLQARGVALAEVEKVLISPNSPWRDPEDTVALAINKDGNLFYWKYGQERWTHITDDQHLESQYDDIIVYKGQFYVVDKLGTVSWIDSSMRPIQFSPLMCGGGDRKHLMEWGGDIFVIDRYHGGSWNAYRNNRFRRFEEAVDFKVYRLDQEWGKWDEVRNLGDAVFFLGTNCSFSVSIRDFDGCPRNCIYYVEADGLTERVLVFSLGNRSTNRAAHLPAYRQILWPPSCWFTSILSIFTF